MTNTHSVGKVLVRGLQIFSCLRDVLLGQGREVRPVDVQIRLPLSAEVNNIVANGLPFTITICPDDQAIDVSTINLDVLNDLLGVLDRHFLKRDCVKRLHVCLLPVLAAVWVLETHDVAKDRGDSQLAPLPVHLVFEFINWVVLRLPHELR